MAESFSIDLDNEKVLLDGTWYSHDGLAKRIRDMVQGGDFHLAKPSAALEALEAAVSNLSVFTLKLRPEVLTALSGAANRSGKTIDALAREILDRGLAVAPTPTPAPIPLTAAAPAPAPIPLTAAVAPVTEPATEMPTPIALTPKKPAAAPAPGTPDAEKGWFNRR